jgi:ABC-type multidrug transport system fused ATPase/permease subunit
MRGDLRHGWNTLRLLYEMDRSAFLVSTLTSLIQSLVFPLILIIIWQGLSLIAIGTELSGDLGREGMVLLGGLFALLALQTILRIVNETATGILQAESAQQVNARIMKKMSEVPYYLFEDNGFQARYGLLISQASYRPGLLVDAFVGSVSGLAASLAIGATLFAFAPILDVLLLILVALTIAETRYHARVVELQTQSAPELFRMTYLAQRSIDASWQRDIRVHNSTILNDEYRVLARTYLSKVRVLLRRYQAIRMGVGLGAAAMMTLAMGAVFWSVSQSPTGLTEAAVLLPAVVMGLSQGRSFSTSWGALRESLGYLAQLFEFLDHSFEKPEAEPRGAAGQAAVSVATAA